MDQPGAGPTLTHVGGPTLLVELAGWRILSDPTFDAPGRRYAFGWGTSSRKVAGPALAAADLAPLDLVLLTHDHHADNLDDEGRDLLADAPVVVTTTSGARRLGGGRVRGLDAWARTRVEADGRPALTITATPCRHGPPLSRPIVGEVVGFALDVEGHGTVWISGDTVLYPGVREVVDRLDVDVAVVHLGGVRFPITGPLRYTMTARQGVELVGELRPRVAVPVHDEGWSHFRDDRSATRRALSEAPHEVRDRFQVLTPGEATDLSAGR